MGGPPTVRWQVAAGFVVVCLVWGTTPFAIKVGLVAGWEPLWFCALRLLTAALLVAPLLLTRLSGSPLGRRGWLTVLPMGVLGIAVNFGLTVWGQQYIGASLASLIVGSQPITTSLMDHLASRQLPTRRFVIGLFTGASGMLVIFHGATVPGSRESQGALAVFAGVTIYGAIFVYIKARVGTLNLLRVTAAQNLIGGSLVAAVALGLEGLPRLPSAPAAWTTFAYLSTVSSIAALVLAVWLVGRLGPARFSILSFVTPIVGVAASVSWLHETVEPTTIAGAVLVAAALALTLIRSRRLLAGSHQIVLDRRGGVVQAGQEALPQLCDRDT